MALLGEVLSPIRFWIDLLSHSQLSTHFFYLCWSHKCRNESIWKSHLKSAQELAWLCSHWHEQTLYHSFQQQHTVRQTLNASENPILKLCWTWHATKRIMFAASAVSLHSFQTVPPSSLPLNNLFLLAPMAYFPRYWKGIKTQVISFGTAFNHEGYYHISYKRMIVLWYIHVLFCL